MMFYKKVINFSEIKQYFQSLFKTKNRFLITRHELMIIF
jgi:hypothetical protein